MSKKINWDEPLSDFDRQYALNRGMEEQVRENEARFGKPEHADKSLDDVRTELAEARQRVADLEAEEQRLLNPNVAQQTPTQSRFPHTQGTVVASPVDNTPVDGETPEGAPEPDGDEYDQWTKADLVDEIEERNDKNGSTMSTTGTKAELIERLRADDKARAQAAQ